METKKLAYLSGSPLVSSHETAKLPGPRAHIRGTIQGFRANGWEVAEYIFGDRLSPWAKRGLGEAGSARFSLPPLLWDIGRIGISWINNVSALRTLGREFDLAYERYGLFQLLGRRFQHAGVTWVLETNSPMAYEAKHDRHSLALLKTAERHEIRAYQQCDVLVSVSEKLKRLIVDDYHIDPEKIIVVPNGADTDTFDPVRYEGKRHFSGFTVGFVGSLYPWQGLDMALSALGELRKEGKDISLVIVGDGVLLEELRRLAASSGAADYVHFVGWVSPREIPAWIAGFDVCFSGQKQPQKGELYLSPLKLYEYMAMAKPVVASASEDACTLIQEGYTGFLFTPNSQDELKMAIDRAYQAAPGLTAMGRRARQLIVREHSWTARIRDLLEAIPRIVHRQSGSLPMRNNSSPQGVCS